MKRSKNKKTDTSDFLRYRSGEMKGQERNAFERELQRDAFAEEAAEGFELISSDEALSDLGKLRDKLPGMKRHNRVVFYKIAASVAVLMIVSSIFLMVERKESKPVADLHPATTEMVIAAAEAIKPETPATKDISENQERPFTEVSRERKAESKMMISDAGVPESVNIQEAQNQMIIRMDTAIDLAEPPVTAKSITKNRSELLAESRSASVRQPLKGVVLSGEDGKPVQGASVVIKGTAKGAVTGPDGSFSINPPENNNIYNNINNNIYNNITIVASYIGMNSQEANAVPGKPLEIVLTPDVAALSEVVVVGYGVKQADDTDEEYSPPQPSNGRSGYNKYMQENIRRPDSSTASQRVIVVADFKVRKDGTPDSIRIIRSPDAQFSSEAVRLIRSGPRWKPAIRNGEVIEDEVRLRIVFK